MSILLSAIICASKRLYTITVILNRGTGRRKEDIYTEERCEDDDNDDGHQDDTSNMQETGDKSEGFRQCVNEVITFNGLLLSQDIANVI